MVAILSLPNVDTDCKGKNELRVYSFFRQNSKLIIFNIAEYLIDIFFSLKNANTYLCIFRASKEKVQFE